MKLFILFFMLFCCSSFAQPVTLTDDIRHRDIRLEIYLPANTANCALNTKCPVALLSSGHGVGFTQYSFIANKFNANGYLVVAIEHEQPEDPPLATSGNFQETRRENWVRGAQTIRVVQQQLKDTYAAYDFDHVTLIGHSNGGDISAWLASENPEFIKQIITLDNRRAPLPRNKAIAVLSIRASDFEADKGVLPNRQEKSSLGLCVVKIPHAQHNDLTDEGPAWLTLTVQQILDKYLKHADCKQLTKI